MWARSYLNRPKLDKAEAPAAAALLLADKADDAAHCPARCLDLLELVEDIAPPRLAVYAPEQENPAATARARRNVAHAVVGLACETGRAAPGRCRPSRRSAGRRRVVDLDPARRGVAERQEHLGVAGIDEAGRVLKRLEECEAKAFRQAWRDQGSGQSGGQEARCRH